MASTNQSPEYQRAEGKFLAAQTIEQKLRYLKEMIRECPKHKSSEKMLANLKTRYRKLKYANEKEIKQKKRGKEGIKKEDTQAVIVGETGVGKSRLLTELTNAKPKIASTPLEQFTTKTPIVGMMNYNGIQTQIIEIPAIGSEYYDRGIVYTADTVITLITELSQLEKIEECLDKDKKKIIVFLDNSHEPKELRKISATLQSKKYNFVIVNLETKEGLEELKEKLFQSFDKIRIYTKEPGKEPDKNRPLILEKNSSVKDVAEKILHGFSNKVKETKIWGPSSKFAGQKVGLNHVLKDLDVIEFKTN